MVLFVSNKIISVFKKIECVSNIKNSISLLHALKGLYNFTPLFFARFDRPFIRKIFFVNIISLFVLFFVEQLSLIASSFMENHLKSCTKCF